MKINYLLLLKIVIVEIIYIYAVFFIALFSLFLYFGSGVGASSPQALLWGKIATYTIILPPILFNLYKIIKYRKSNQFEKCNSYIVAEILIALFLSYQIHAGHLMS